MERLTDHERSALTEVGEPFCDLVPDVVFEKLQERGWGYWAADPEQPGDKLWFVTEAGRRALELDTLASRVE